MNANVNTDGSLTAQFIACEVCGDCLTIPPNPAAPGVLLGGLWCKNLIVVKERINIVKSTGTFSFLFTEKLPFELLMLRFDDTGNANGGG